MLNFENLDGFVVDLDNVDDIYDRLRDATIGNEELYTDIVNFYSIDDKKNWLVDHYIDTYKYVFMLKNNKIFVCTADLFTEKPKSNLKLPSWVME